MGKVVKKSPEAKAEMNGAVEGGTFDETEDDANLDDVPPVEAGTPNPKRATPKARALFALENAMKSLGRARDATRGFGAGSSICTEKITDALKLLTDCGPLAHKFPDRRTDRVVTPRVTPVRIGGEYFIVEDKCDLYRSVIGDPDEHVTCVTTDGPTALVEQIHEGKTIRFPISVHHLIRTDQAS